MAIITKCDESIYQLNDTIVKLYRKLKGINSITKTALCETYPVYLPVFQDMANTFLSFNPWWRILNYTKKAVNQFHTNAMGSYDSNCYSDITSKK